VRVLLADDHPLLRMGMRRILEAHGAFEVVAEASTGGEVLPLIGRTAPDVVLLDLRMPGVDGFSCLDRVRQRHPETAVVIISVDSEPERVQGAFDRGACGFISKSVDPSEFTSSIVQAVNGGAPPAIRQPNADRDRAEQADGLTDRELTIVKAVARGLSNSAIASDLWITEQTVKFHLTNIYRKLGVANRTEAARWAFTHGVVAESVSGLEQAS
jgi:DNA-binding NarL/FixJ family response regulator